MLYDSLAVNKNGTALDSASGDAANKIEVSDFDSMDLNHNVQMLRKLALTLVLVFADDIVSKNLAEDELPSDHFAMLLAGASGDDEDDEFEVDEATLQIITANIQDALVSLGVSQDLIDSAFGDDVAEADQALETIAETVESNVPQGDDLDAFVNEFVYGDDEPLLDAAAVGKTTVKKGKFGNIVYKAMKAVRNGHIKIVNKRVGGKVKLTVKQRASLAKARRKAFSSSAIKQRLRSFTKGKRNGLY